MRILFIGNSFTYYNNLPNLFEQLSIKAGMEVEAHMHAGSDKSLCDHLYDSDVITRIKNEQWDYVVLQEHSLYALEEKAKLESALKRFVSHIKESGAKPILFETWAREHLPETTSEIAEIYRELAGKYECLLVPVGTVWQAVLKKDPTLKLYKEDRSHPTILGTYLTAVTFVKAIFGDSVKTLSNTYELMDGVSVLIDEGKAELFVDVVEETFTK